MRSCPPTAATTLIPHSKDGDWRASGLVKIIVVTGMPGIPPHLSRFGREEWEWHGEAMGLSAGVEWTEVAVLSPSWESREGLWT